MAKKKKKKTKQKMEFSKFAFICTAVLFGMVIVASIALMWKTDTIDPLSYLITTTSGIMATATGFYYAKARAENLIKLSKDHGLTINEVKSISKSVEEDNTTYDTESIM